MSRYFKEKHNFAVERMAAGRHPFAYSSARCPSPSLTCALGGSA